MQPTEGDNGLLVAIVDETYCRVDEDAWQEASEGYRAGLEREFGCPFTEGNIGPGADLPAFITLLQTASVPNWLLMVSAFFLGKPINENFSAWSEMGKKIRTFFKRPAYLNRQGAAVLAVERIFEELGSTPRSIQLLGYRVLHMGETEDLAQIEMDNEIADAPDTLRLGFIKHVFEISVDGSVFRVSVDGRSTEIFQL